MALVCKTGIWPSALQGKTMGVAHSTCMFCVCGILENSLSFVLTVYSYGFRYFQFEKEGSA